MGVDAEQVLSQGDVLRRLRAVEKDLERLHAERRLESASIGAGGLRVKGGHIIIQDADGNETMRLATDGLTLTGLLRVLGALDVSGDIDLSGTMRVAAGSIEVADGSLVINDGTGAEALRLSTAGLSLQGLLDVLGEIQVAGGGGVDVLDGGRIRARYPSNNSAISFGSLVSTETGSDAGHGLLVRANVPAGTPTSNILRAGTREDGTTMVWIGANTTGPEWVASASSEVGFFSELGALATLAGDYSVVVAGSPSDGVFIATDDTTGGSANLSLSGTTGQGRLARVTSRAANKVDVEDLDVDPAAVLRLRPRTWRDRAEVTADPDTDRWHVGLVAEEVDAAGLTEFVEYDSHGQPHAVAYDRLAVALLGVLQDQQQRLDRLDGGGGARPQQARGRKPKRRLRGEPTVLMARRPGGEAPGTETRSAGSPPETATPSRNPARSTRKRQRSPRTE